MKILCNNRIFKLVLSLFLFTSAMAVIPVEARPQHRQTILLASYSDHHRAHHRRSHHPRRFHPRYHGRHNYPVRHHAPRHPYAYHRISAKAAAVPPVALTVADRAYHTAKKLHHTKSSIVTLVDFSKPSNKKRLWVIDMNTKKVLLNTWVAHGVASGGLYSNHFSDQVNSHASSIGVYKTGNIYYGQNGLSLRLIGLEPGFNKNVARRNIVVHGARYVSHGETYRVGRSWGCFAVNPEVLPKLVNKIKNGDLLVAYYPSQKWLNSSKFI